MSASILGGRRLPVGAELIEGGTHFRVWAPRAKKVSVVFESENRTADLAEYDSGYFSGLVEADVGALYKYSLDGGAAYPDPISRFQPNGPHGPSMVVDPGTFSWSDFGWKGVELKGSIIYELHIGTFTTEGTWQSASKKLPYLRDIGITVLEIMPVAEFPGRFNWGYDGVNLFAPSHLYGTPDDFRAFIDTAHSFGLAIILDVVFNHFGPDGNYLEKFSERYFTDRYKNEWGRAVNFDDEGSAHVREYFSANVKYWIEEFHLDGYRFDATQQIFDSSEKHILAELAEVAQEACGDRRILLIGENESQETKIMKSPKSGGYGFDALWNDDFHHSAIVALTGKNEAYYSDYLGTSREFVASAKRGFLYQGQFYNWQKKRRGKPALDVPPEKFIVFLENHDQIANSGQGLRLWQTTSPGRYRTMTAALLLHPGTPLLFQGQEYGATNPFLYFADHSQELGELVRKGREKFLSQFPSLATSDVTRMMADPSDIETFERCKLLEEITAEKDRFLALHGDLIKLRRQIPGLSKGQLFFDATALSEDAFVIRYFDKLHDDRLLLVNLGRELNLSPVPEPLLAPSERGEWEVLWSSENVKYGGGGIRHPEIVGNWRIPGETAVVLQPIFLEEKSYV